MVRGKLFLCLFCVSMVFPVKWAASWPKDEAVVPVGNITNVSRRSVDGSVVIKGWVCEPSKRASGIIRLYVAAPFPYGQRIASIVADSVDVSAIGKCRANDTPRGFLAALAPAVLFRYGGLRLFVQAESSDGHVNGPIRNPDTLRMPEWRAGADTPKICQMSNITTLKDCFARASSFDVFSFEADITCGSAAECCASNGSALIELNELQGKTIAGNNHTLRRTGGQATCPAIRLSKANDILVDRLNLDEDEKTPPCELSMPDCAATVRVQSSYNIKLTAVKVYFGKGYVISVWETDGFALHHSLVSEAGIIGLYVGHYQYGVSRNVVIADSVFSHARTNGIALQGAMAADDSNPVLVIGNIVNDNHWHGLWPVGDVPGGITSGGQVLIADGRDIRLVNNVIANGACQNCRPERQTVSDVEIADQAPPPAGVFNLTIDHNAFLNGAGVAIRQNPGTLVSGTVISDNRITGFPVIDSVSQATRAANMIEPNKAAAGTLPASYGALRRSPTRKKIFGPGSTNSADANVEIVFDLSPSPRPDAISRPIYQCAMNNRRSGNTASLSENCDGRGDLISIFGFSYEASYPGTKPFYSCRLHGFDADTFLSWDNHCEGQEFVSEMGFAIDGGLVRR